MKARKYNWLFFDLDGTLWDFTANSEFTLRLILHDIAPQLDGREQDFLDIYHHYNDILWVEYGQGKITKELLRWKRFYDALAHFGITDKHVAEEFGERYLAMSPHQTRVVPNAFELLNYLRERGYHIYLLTNGFAEVQHIKITESGLAPYIERTFTSDETGYKKPHKLAFDSAIKCVNARKNQSLMIGDEWETDIVGAQQAGIDQVYFNTRNRTPEFPVTYQITSLTELMTIL